MKRVLLIIDWKLKPTGWSFLDALQAFDHRFDVLGEDLPVHYRSALRKAVSLWSGYIRLGLKAFFRSKRYDVILSWQGAAGLWYAIFRRLFSRSGTPIILMGFFYAKRQNPLYGRLRYRLVLFALGRVERVVCYSSREAEYYNKLFRCDRKFVFTHLALNTLRKDVEETRKLQPEAYVFSAGTSNRDYKTLFEAVKDLDVRVVVVTKRMNVKGLRVPENVDLKFNVYGDAFRQLLWRSRFVVVPLEDAELSSGQMVLLDSMLYRKVPVVTRTWGSTDYITHMENGLLTAPHNSRDLRDKITYLLNRPDEVKRLAAAGHRMVMKNYTMARLAGFVCRLIDRY